MPDDLEGAKPSVVAELVAYFTKPEAYFVTGGFITLLHQFVVADIQPGQTVNVDGGLIFD